MDQTRRDSLVLIFTLTLSLNLLPNLNRHPNLNLLEALSDNFPYHFAVHVREPHVPAAEAVSHSFVIHA